MKKRNHDISDTALLSHRAGFLRMLCAVLSCVILLTSALLLSSCKSSSKQPGGTNEPSQSTQNTEPQDTAAEHPVSLVPKDLTFEGESVKILLRTNMKEEFDTEYTGAMIDNAVYTRNKKVEEVLKIELDYDPRKVDGGSEDDQFKGYKAFLRNAAYNDETFDIVTMYSYYMVPLASEGIYYNLLENDEKNYISPTLAWYNQSFVSEATYKDRLYAIIGDATLSVTEKSVLTFFNVDELYRTGTDLTADALYQTVLDGDWTLGYLKELVTDVYADMNGNGQTADDFYGLSINNGSMCIDAVLVGLNVRITQKDSDGNNRFALNTARAKEAYSALYDLMYNTTTGVFLGSTKNGYYRAEDSSACTYYAEQMFCEKRAVFAFGELKSAQQYAKNTSLKYGMLPLPKADSIQPDYQTAPQGAYTSMALLSNVKSRNRLEIATAVMETVSEQSYLLVRPEYYDIAYKTRYASSADTATLFDMIIRGITFDFGTIYSNVLGNPAWKIRGNIQGSQAAPSGDLGKVYTQYESSFNESLKKLTDKLDSLP